MIITPKIWCKNQVAEQRERPLFVIRTWGAAIVCCENLGESVAAHL